MFKSFAVPYRHRIDDVPSLVQCPYPFPPSRRFFRLINASTPSPLGIFEKKRNTQADLVFFSNSTFDWNVWFLGQLIGPALGSGLLPLVPHPLVLRSRRPLDSFRSFCSFCSFRSFRSFRSFYSSAYSSVAASFGLLLLIPLCHSSLLIPPARLFRLEPPCCLLALLGDPLILLHV